MVSNYALAATHPTTRFLCFLQRFVGSVCSISQQCIIFNTFWKTHYTAYMIFIQAQSMTTQSGKTLFTVIRVSATWVRVLFQTTRALHCCMHLLFLKKPFTFARSFLSIPFFYLFCFATMFCRQNQKRLRGELSAFLLLVCMHLSCPLGFGFPLLTVAWIAWFRSIVWEAGDVWWGVVSWCGLGGNSRVRLKRCGAGWGRRVDKETPLTLQTDDRFCLLADRSNAGGGCRCDT